PELREELSQLGVQVTITACDVADRDAVAQLLTGIDQLTAIVHAAGVGLAGTVDELTPAELAYALAGKVTGALHLDELARPELEAFVLFSSNAGVWGSGGQGAYAAANAHLDALAEQRRDRGQQATSIAWGAWGGEAGMMATDGVGEMLRRRGVLEMAPELAIAALQQSLDHDETFTAIADIDWQRFIPGFTARRPSPLLQDLPEVRSLLQTAAPERSGSDSALTEQLAAAPAGDRQRLLLDAIRTEVAAVLNHADAAAVEAGRAFKDLGFDSLTSVDLRNRLNTLTGLRLPATLVFDYPTPQALAEQLAAELSGTVVQDELSPARAAGGEAGDDPVVIVGMACALPGGIRSPDELWAVVTEGRDQVAGLPTDRGWDAEVFLAAEKQLAESDTAFLQTAGFLDAVAEFDAEFFQIPAAEAAAMDPQQRLLLEMSWESFERAGIDPRSLVGSRTGVYLGTFFQGYASRAQDVDAETAGYLAGGSAPAIASGRVAYALGLEGPTFTVDTGCSSSAVALHLAAKAVRAGECSLALAGGVTVMSHPVSFLGLGGGAAPDGRCKPFSADADGTGWGEGAGMVLLERLSDAERNGHRVLAVVRGSAVNHDGATNGLTAPSGRSQQRVIRAALADAGVTASQIDAVEAHGTGSPLGDSVEAQALAATYGRDRPADRPLLLGTVKSNIGHPQAASGVVGVIKMVLALQHGTLPGMLNADRPSTELDWPAAGLSLLAEQVGWPETGAPRRVGVSSFGGSGTKVHLVLEQAPEPPSASRVVPEPGRVALITPEPAGVSVSAAASVPAVLPYLLSGRSAAALAGQARRLREFVQDRPEFHPLDIAYSLGGTRAVFDHRAVLLAEDQQRLLDGLAAVERDENSPSVVGGVAVDGARTVLVLPAAGSDGAGRALYESFPAYAQAWDEVCAQLDVRLDRSLREVLTGSAPAEGVLAAAAFANGVASWRLLQAWGVEPAAIAGCGAAKVAAVHLAGGLGLEDAVTLLLARGQGTDCVRGLTFAQLSIPIIDLADGATDPGRMASDDYWTDERDRSDEADQLLKGLGFDIVLDLSVDVFDRQAQVGDEGEVVVNVSDQHSMIGNEGEVAALFATLAAAQVQGMRVDWASMLGGFGASKAELPTYAFQRSRHWL
ncbi:MAG: type I polyketide synthase, partial [Actinomycetota bacterium]|nr:type I polyketide synthase [Actinomycetota bacterium]